MNKIYTYADPFALKETFFWEEIKDSPNLCVSQTLVNGLKAAHGRDNFLFISTIDNFLKDFYEIWVDNPENEIKQYLSLSEEIITIPNKKLQKSLKFNQREVMQALKFLIELEVEANGFDESQCTEEQQVFLTIYKNLLPKDEWGKLKKIEDKDQESVLESVECLLIKEEKKVKEQKQKFKQEATIKEQAPNVVGNRSARRRATTSSERQLIELEKELQHINKIKEMILKPTYTVDKIVIHGVHQFTPLLLKFIKHLNQNNISVIFVFHYMEQYEQTFATWKRVYSWTGIDFESDPTLSVPIKEKSLGKAIGDLIDGKRTNSNVEGMELIKFDNITSFSDHVSHIYKNAKGPKKLANMAEHFYAPNNSQVHELLKMYHPEQFGNKHFLAYPIGQYILGLYNMWDADKKMLIINERSLRECLSINIVNSKEGKSPLQIYNKIALFFKDLQNIDQFLKRLDRLIKVVGVIEEGKEWFIARLRGFSFYHCSSSELKYFQKVISDLFTIANHLFGENTNGYVNYQDHFKRLVKLISTNFGAEVSDEENEILALLEERLSRVDQLQVEGSIEDLKETIHFYLNRPQDEDDANWIVKNFEQLEGDLLVEKSKPKNRTALSNFHLSILSDQKMKVPIKDLLPWPLNSNFFNAYNGYLEELDTVFTCKKEYSRFISYAFFNVNYFSNDKLLLSFIENSEGEKETPYFLLDMVGVKVKNEPSPRMGVNTGKREQGNNGIDIQLNEVNEARSISLCEYRYVHDYLLEDDNYFENEYHCKLYYRAILVEWIMRESNKRNVDPSSLVAEENKNLREFFPFWKDIDFYDMEQWVRNDVNRTPDDEYLQFRVQFLYRKLTDEDGDDLLRPAWEYDSRHFSNEQKKFGNKSLRKLDTHPLLCQYCKVRDVCLHHFTTEGEN
ncbi:hypothetical protein [Bacillus sp. Marseille-P3661]|uniref:hypothetical protein n=1 Tax=Bacillus sp. Marseille-P3661 TaxID=1936234 RepID=UPI000C82DCF6|nr:hypothetical protein [Bacillus sp. Marseille-P3661]